MPCALMSGAFGEGLLRKSRGEPVAPQERPKVRRAGCSALVLHGICRFAPSSAHPQELSSGKLCGLLYLIGAAFCWDDGSGAAALPCLRREHLCWEL